MLASSLAKLLPNAGFDGSIWPEIAGSCSYGMPAGTDARREQRHLSRTSESKWANTFLQPFDDKSIENIIRQV
jgi:hypothetical protein